MDVAQDHRDSLGERRRIGIEGIARQRDVVDDRKPVRAYRSRSVLNLFHGQRIQLRGQILSGRDAHFFEDSFGAVGGNLDGSALDLLAAHGHDAMEQAGSRGSGHQRRALGSAARLAEDEHARWIAAKLGDIFAHPLERQHQVKLSRIARLRILGRQIAEIEIAESVEPVVHRDHHNIAAMHQPRAIVEIAVYGAVVVRAAMKVDQHGALAVVAQTGGPDIQAQAIFAFLAVVADVTRGQRRETPRRGQLRSHGCEAGALHNVAPRRRRDGCFEARLCGVCSVGDAPESVDAIDQQAAHLARRSGGQRRGQCRLGPGSFPALQSQRRCGDCRAAQKIPAIDLLH